MNRLSSSPKRVSHFPIAVVCIMAVASNAFAQGDDLPDAVWTTHSQHEIEEQMDAERPDPWSASRLIYRNATTALSFDEGAELTYNPYYEMSVTLLPSWRFTDFFSLSGQMSFFGELTDSDWTTQRHEIVVSDLTLVPRFNFVIPGIDLSVALDTAFAFPTSKTSQARTMNLALGPGVTLSKSFPVLSGLQLAYSFRATYYWHEYTTGEYESPIIEGCTHDCDEYINTGVRNPTWRLSNTFMAAIAFFDQLSFSISYTVVVNPLNESASSSIVSLTPLEPTDTRFTNSFNLALNYTPWPYVGFELGVDTTNQQLTPDSQSYYSPFFNRFTIVYFDIILGFGG